MHMEVYTYTVVWLQVQIVIAGQLLCILESFGPLQMQEYGVAYSVCCGRLHVLSCGVIELKNC